MNKIPGSAKQVFNNIHLVTKVNMQNICDDNISSRKKDL